ncbi:hypothetical protein [Proteus mirabilis]|uniref:hypothetical protein n=1 Tax=Proteus mirabilis TaxID=584 RepID=UPI0034D728F4
MIFKKRIKFDVGSARFIEINEEIYQLFINRLRIVGRDIIRLLKPSFSDEFSNFQIVLIPRRCSSNLQELCITFSRFCSYRTVPFNIWWQEGDTGSDQFLVFEIDSSCKSFVIYSRGDGNREEINVPFEINNRLIQLVNKILFLDRSYIDCIRRQVTMKIQQGDLKETYSY